jgi:hypothetical protein
MPTATEQKALAFVAIVILLGGAARVVRAGALAPPTPTSAEEQALARQAFAANSSAFDRRSAKAEKRPKLPKLSLKRRYDGAQTIAGVAGVPLSDVRPGTPELPSGPVRNGFPPPWPRIDVGARPQPGLPSVPAASRPGLPGGAGPIDLDTAGETEIEALPRIGPALAKRIVANRDSLGPFGSLSGLRRVRGIGAGTTDRLAMLVTFSSQTRH